MRKVVLDCSCASGAGVVWWWGSCTGASRGCRWCRQGHCWLLQCSTVKLGDTHVRVDHADVNVCSQGIDSSYMDWLLYCKMVPLCARTPIILSFCLK